LQRFAHEEKMAFSVYKESVRTKRNPQKELRGSEQDDIKNEFSKYMPFNGSAFLIAKLYNIDNIYYIPVNTTLFPAGGLSWLGRYISARSFHLQVRFLAILSCTYLA
jgi:hypothetical protein